MPAEIFSFLRMAGDSDFKDGKKVTSPIPMMASFT